MSDTTQRNIRSAWRHVQRGRETVKKQYELIERLRLRGRSTREAEDILAWFLKTQREFEEHYETLLMARRDEVLSECESPSD